LLEVFSARLKSSFQPFDFIAQLGTFLSHKKQTSLSNAIINISMLAANDTPGMATAMVTP
jgi:hypothetical protein